MIVRLHVDSHLKDWSLSPEGTRPTVHEQNWDPVCKEGWDRKEQGVRVCTTEELENDDIPITAYFPQ